MIGSKKEWDIHSVLGVRLENFLTRMYGMAAKKAPLARRRGFAAEPKQGFC